MERAAAGYQSVMKWAIATSLRDSLPGDRDGHALPYVHRCIAESSTAMIRNVDTRMKVLDTGNVSLPVSINSGEDMVDNSYVVSPLTTYTGYATDEVLRMNRPWVAWPLVRLINPIGRLLQAANIDRLVQVNNWLLSTNLYPVNWDGRDLQDVKDFVHGEFPDHAISFRSLNQFSNADLIGQLKSLGFIAVPSRQVYLFDAREGIQSSFLRRHNSKMDAKLLGKMPYRLLSGDDLQDDDYPRLEALYNLLYLGKYSRLNPQFTADWLRCGQRDGWLELRALCTDDRRIDGVVGWFSNERILTAPVVGYDTSLPQSLGLYRLITQMCLQEAVNRRCILNFSSGAAHFKRLRGGRPEIEYSMVFADHLSKKRRRAWRTLSRVLHATGIPIMKTFKL
jgi:hypothetical protein